MKGIDKKKKLHLHGTRRGEKEEQQPRNANERLLEKRELVTWGRPEGGGGEKKCKNSYGPGRVVMKI